MCVEGGGWLFFFSARASLVKSLRGCLALLFFLHALLSASFRELFLAVLGYFYAFSCDFFFVHFFFLFLGESERQETRLASFQKVLNAV